jgi:transcriptional regulator with XRE-family HTH domain
MSAKFGAEFRRMRKHSGFTQRELAELLNVSFTYISKIENGRLDYPPSINFINEAAIVFEDDTVYLVGLAGQIDSSALMERCKHEPIVAELLFLIARGALPTADIETIINGYNLEQWGIWGDTFGNLRQPYADRDPIDVAMTLDDLRSIDKQYSEEAQS